MLSDLLIRAPVGLLPVLIFLVILLYMDSYKLVSLRTILWVIFAGALLPVCPGALPRAAVQTNRVSSSRLPPPGILMVEVQPPRRQMQIQRQDRHQELKRAGHQTVAGRYAQGAG